MIRSKLAALVSAAVMAVAGQAFAITGDWIPDNDHPFVGLIAFYGSDGEFIWRCSGSLISPTVVLDGRALCRHGGRRDHGAHLVSAERRGQLRSSDTARPCDRLSR
jgi:hypothetical protein